VNDAVALLALPLAAGVVATVSHTVLGRQVLARGIVFIDLAIAQCAALGLLIGAVLELHGWEQTALGIVAAMIGAGLVAGLCHVWPLRREAAIGLLYVVGASLTVMVAAIDPHGLQRVSQLLAGDPLWVTGSTLWPLLVATVPFTWLMVTRPTWMQGSRYFYPVFALMISLSLPLLGLYLVFATLILPALVAESLKTALANWIGMALSIAGYALGLLASLRFDTPSGPSIVIAMVILALISTLIFRPAMRRNSAPDSPANPPVQ